MSKIVNQDWLQVLVALPSEHLHFDTARTTPVLASAFGAVYSTPDRLYTAIPGGPIGYTVVLHGVGTISEAETISEAQRDIFRDRRNRAHEAFFGVTS